MPCSLTEMYKRFGEKYCHHLQGRESKRSKKPRKTVCFFVAGCLLSFLSDPKNGGSRFLRNVNELVVQSIVLCTCVYHTAHLPLPPPGMVSQVSVVESLLGHTTTSLLLGFPQSLQEDAGVTAFIVPRRFSFSSFSTNYSP
jgi:hypothetical protein